MYLRKDGVDMTNQAALPRKKMETADAAPGKEIPGAIELTSDHGIVITLSGENINKIDNICIYFKEGNDE